MILKILASIETKIIMSQMGCSRNHANLSFNEIKTFSKDSDCD